MSEQEQAKPQLIYKKMAAILKDVDAITKSRTNQQGQSFKYRGIDDIYNELHECFAKEEVFCTTNVLHREQVERISKSGGNLFYTVCKIAFRFYAEDGSFVESVIIGEAMDSGDKSTNKSMAIAHKYCLLQAFLVPTEDDKDPDGQSHQVAPKQQWPEAARQPQQYQSREYRPAQSGTGPAGPSQPPARQNPPAAPAQQNTPIPQTNPQQAQAPQGQASSTPPQQSNVQYATVPQLKRLHAIKNEHGWSDDQVKECLHIFYNIDTTKNLTLKQYDEFTKIMQAHSFQEAMHNSGAAAATGKGEVPF